MDVARDNRRSLYMVLFGGVETNDKIVETKAVTGNIVLLSVVDPTCYYRVPRSSIGVQI